MEPRERRERAVGRAIVDEHGLPGLSARLECRLQLLVEQGDAAFLVVHRDDDEITAGSWPRAYGGGGGGSGRRVVRQPHLRHAARAELPLEAVSAADHLAHFASSL
jgi:hypothetical protein